jgi:hypothetical protein
MAVNAATDFTVVVRPDRLSTVCGFANTEATSR